ncbi:putative disease resistance RPP13-like protein 1 [Vicia villosa]|uniref:putative disease resistance RPP13-like protein 1 n=1 Tax=Vicia villosa TaxID=3911 RepID=UPI00273C4672|nr:putative disease resistance RPP13-like protein 1 [Vicia villosa]
MAGAAIGSAFLTATVQTLVEKLASKEFRDYIKNTKLNVSFLKQLRLTLLTLQPLLDAAEEKQINTPSVKDWLDGLKDAVYDAEDLLNQISYDSLRCKMENTQPASKTNQVWNLLSSPFKNIYGEINSQMKDMCETLKLFADNKDILSLQTISVRVSHRTPSSPMFNESVIVGRKDDQEKVMNMLLSESNTNMGVLAIVGMGGVGKTTLAQLAYNDENVQKHFDLTAWACVSEDFDVFRVTKNLLESVTKTPSGTDNLDLLRVGLKENLKDRRFLIVLDDLWNDTHRDWEDLVSPLIYGKNGSKLIITTRHKKVADAARTIPIFELDPLSDEDSWSLLSKHAFGSGDFSEAQQRNVEAIGRKIARKCGGLPIAAKSLGGLLRSKVDPEEWVEVLNNDIWNLQNDNILPALRLSYQYLSSQLKRCFSYCSIFPKDYPLDRKQLVLLWMAEGFLDHSQDKKTMEEAGDECFTELLSRSLIQQLHDDSRGQTFVLHDLVNDLATVVSGKTCYRLEFGDVSFENVRHLSYNQELFDIFKKFKTFYKFKCLRSFLAIGSSRWDTHCLSGKVVDGLLPTFGRLRVLSLSKYRNITTLPVTIGNLVLLRYLDLSYTDIASLPNTICNLYYLQTLILSCCSKLTELPEHVGKLSNLRHLYIDRTSITEMPKQIAELENLQTLTDFVVGKKNIGLCVRELGKFPKLRGKLLIKNLQNVNDVMEVSGTNLKSKEHIEELTLQWGKETDDTLNEKNVLDMLEPSTNLEKLSIVSYGGTSFPSWFGDPSFSNMVYLSIGNCVNCMTLPPLGKLPSLKNLCISGMRILETIGQQFYGMAAGGSSSSFQPFQALEKLEFMYMENWKEWCPFPDNMFPFPRLKTLKLSNCPKLKGHLPSHLPSLEEIEICNCVHLLETPPTQHWLSSIKKIHIVEDSDSISNTERNQYSLLESDSPCLLQEIEIRSRHMLKYVPKMIINSTCLRELVLNHISFRTKVPTNGLPTLQSLSIQNCENLTFLPPDMWSNYTSLVNLRLDRCNSLTSIPLNCFPMLQILSIIKCRSLESIFISETLSCSSSALKSFDVNSCEELRSLPQRMDTLTALEGISLINLPNLNLSLCEGVFLPPNLQSIMVDSVRITKPVTEWGLQCITALSSLHIRGGDIVNILLKELLLPISLVYLKMDGLSEMKPLEGIGLRHLSSLETLSFNGCPGLVSNALPSSLKTLYFSDCPRLESLPEKAFPSSLKTLCLTDCPRLESLPEKAFPSSLKLLSLADCPRLESLPQKAFPSLLKSLYFSNCPRLESLQEDSLPTSLERLYISDCPLLEERYKRKEHWSKIAHIPVIEINFQLTI